MVFFPETVGIPSLCALARKLLELLSDYETEKEPLLFHVFSNSGASLYRYVQEPADPALLPPACGGTTFDSSPGDKSLVGSLSPAISHAGTLCGAAHAVRCGRHPVVTPVPLPVSFTRCPYTYQPV